MIPAFGVSTLWNLPDLAGIVSQSHTIIYHLAGPVSALIVPALFNLSIIAALSTVCLMSVKPNTRMEAILWSLLIALVPSLVMRDIAAIYPHHLPHVARVTVLIATPVFVVALCTLWKPSRSPFYSRVYGIASSSLMFAAVFGFILAVQSIWIGWKARHLNDISSIVPPTALSSGPHHPLVLWIVFDELSYDQVYGSRYPGLKLPMLDSFATESTVFSRVVPAGIQTDVVLPSLISGVPGDKLRISPGGDLLDLHSETTALAKAHWQPFNQSQTVFADAKSLGYHPAIVGWYNPYCRILANELSSCFWSNDAEASDSFTMHALRGNLFSHIVSALQEVPGFLFPHHFRRYGDIANAEWHIKDYKQIYGAADETLGNPSLDFVLLHLPIPHPGGIYDRRRAVLTTAPSTYIDNLALVDRYFDHLRETLEQEHQWNGATILVMGDHSWRTKLLWEVDPRWSPEEQRASHGGKFDDRPFYALKLPHQADGAQLRGSFRANDTRLLLDALLQHKIQTPRQLALWAQQHP